MSKTSKAIDAVFIVSYGLFYLFIAVLSLLVLIWMVS